MIGGGQTAETPELESWVPRSSLLLDYSLNGGMDQNAHYYSSHL